LGILGAALAIATVSLAGVHATTAHAGAKKTSRPDCKALLPIGKVEEAVGGEVTLEHFGHSDFIRNATTPGTERGTECVYGTTEATANAYGIAGTFSAAFEESPKQWNAYRASAKSYPGLEATTFSPVALGGGSQAFVLHQVTGGGEPDIYYLYVFTKEHNMKTEEALAREIATSLDSAGRAAR
jgi:hypothetical protein